MYMYISAFSLYEKSKFNLIHMVNLRPNKLKVRKTTRRGGGLNYVFKNFYFLRSEKLFPDSESEIVQSLSAADNSKRTEKERTQAIIQVPSTNRK